MRNLFAPALLAMLFVARASAATAVDELLRYVPSNVAFCFVARDLRARGEALADSPFVDALRKTHAAETIGRSDELAQLNRLQEQLQKQLGLDWNKLRNDILGDGIAFAYRPGRPGKPDEEEGLILIRARSPKAIAELVDHFNDLQKATGEVKGIEQRAHGGVAYFCREEKDRAPTYYCLRGPVLLLSGNEGMLLSALDLEHATAPEAEPALAREFRLLGAERAVLALWINPRAFDSLLQEKARSPEPAAAAIKVFVRYWSALEGVCFSMNLDKDLSFSIALRGKNDQLPAAAQRFLATAARPSDLWQTFPDKSIIAGASRFDLPALVEAISDFLPADGRPAVVGELNRVFGPPLGKEDIVKEVLPCLGPDAGFCLYAPAEKEKNWSARGFAALKVAAGDPSAPVDRSLLAGIRTVATLAVFAHNAKDPEHPLALKTTLLDNREVQYFKGEGVFPPGLQPAFGLHSGYLIVATNPEVLRQFDFRPVPAFKPGEHFTLLRLNFKELRDYLHRCREPLANLIAERNALKPDEVRGRLDGVADTLELLDRLEISQHPGPQRVSFSVRLQLSLPLQK